MLFISSRLAASPIRLRDGIFSNLVRLQTGYHCKSIQG